MAATKGRKLNPKLEEIRQNVPTLPDINKTIEDLITIPKVHAAYLFYTPQGCRLLQKLCLLLSGTKPSYNYSNWEDFGINLGLEPILIKGLKYSLQNEDPTSYVLLAYVQKDDSSIEKILHTLKVIKRHDVLLEIKDSVAKTCNEILMKYNKHNEADIIKPPVAPNCPFILKNLDRLDLNNAKTKIKSEALQKNSISTRKPKQYAKTILLTYTSDADELIEDLLTQLRKPRQDLKIGVVLLNEHRQKLNTNPEEFIYECFAQVDYVFPIITEQYIKKISKGVDNKNVSAVANPDHKYVKYIYRLMNTHYLRNGCQNTMVRCLLPTEATEELLKYPIMDHPLLQIWVKTDEINDLINAILELNF